MTTNSEQFRRLWVGLRVNPLLVVSLLVWWLAGCGAVTYRMDDFTEEDGIELRDLEALIRDSEAAKSGGGGPAGSTVQVKQIAYDFQHEQDEYTLGKNDKLNIFVMNHPEMSSQRVNIGEIAGTTIQKDGKIYLPVINGLQADGLTVVQFRESLKQAAAQYIVEPEVSVEILEYQSQKFFVLGQVNKPGAFPVDGDTTLLEALGMAGGYTQTANLEGSYVLRGNGVLPINLADVLLRGDVSRNPYMRHGDVVFIADGADQKVYVLGEVAQPAAVAIQRNRITLAEALAGAGGTVSAVSRNEIAVVRGGFAKPVVYSVPLETALLYDERIVLRPGDRVIVAPTGLATSSRYMSQILPFLQGPAQLTQTGANAVLIGNTLSR